MDLSQLCIERKIPGVAAQENVSNLCIYIYIYIFFLYLINL